MTQTSALVLFSGGQDSTVCLAYAMSRFDHVETIGFHYGQRHDVEMTCRETVRDSLRGAFPDWASKLGEDHVLDIPVLGEISQTSLTTEAKIEIAENGLPNTFVPGRNLLFLTLAGALAWRRGIGTLVGGMCETDYSGYPDCRRATLDAQQLALTRGMDRAFNIDTPLMWLDKAETWAMAEQLGGDALTQIIIEETHTCYLGDRTHRHDWGYGCGTCPACELRAKGYEAWRGTVPA
ncbi:7-cyano-7-deazaguanine synthase QueC [Hyphomonas sp. FCG-A18]|uniref:7-cyano-7-deazaguanine synthase QueC n=1 Tax=Hyphomonas sp. FCG-A18 TaxID=3080019 RepID=UPI002B30F448|nr:7-cyano-7-deazaguanine synthase QueC [Hyphomonas sp. FCG-A18]